MQDNATLRPYVARHFVQLDELARLGGVPVTSVKALIDCRAIPEPIYTLWPNGAFSSPVGGLHGEPEGEPAHWYSPTSAWWIRRGHDLDPAEAAAAFEGFFVADFVARLPSDRHAKLGYPQVYSTGNFDSQAVDVTARAEWRDWIEGGYGVCLRHGNAFHAITKTCRRAAILAMTDEGRRPRLAADERDALLTVMEELEAVMLPFAPHQRALGTPGLWLDAILVRYGLGTTREATEAADATGISQLCA